MAGIDRRSVLSREVGGIERILDADREPAQRRVPQSGRRGGAAGGRDIERRKGADRGLVAGDRLGAEIDDRARWQGTGLDRLGEIERGQHGLPGASNERHVLHWGPPPKPMWPQRHRWIKGLSSVPPPEMRRVAPNGSGPWLAR